MPEDERELFVKKMVRKLRKEQGLKEDEPVVVANPLNANTAPTDLFDNNAKGEWYFYNPSLKSKGFTEFKGKWGNRPNADNWRRLAAVNQAIQQKQTEDEQLRVAKAARQVTMTELFPTTRLLKKLPLTPEKLKASNDSIENAQIELGKALMEGLEDYEAAILELEKFHERFTYSSRQPEALGYLYYCYMKTGNTQKAECHKSRITTTICGNRSGENDHQSEFCRCQRSRERGYESSIR